MEPHKQVNLTNHVILNNMSVHAADVGNTNTRKEVQKKEEADVGATYDENASLIKILSRRLQI